MTKINFEKIKENKKWICEKCGTNTPPLEHPKHPPGICKNKGTKTGKTNFEKIKEMSIEELAALFSTVHPKCCGFCNGQYMGCLREVSCKSGIKGWLERECEE